MNIFSPDSLLGRFLNLVFDIVILHILWVVTSLPIFTIGASTTALFYACMKRIRTGEGYITKNFFKAFKENFKQSTIIWLILLGIGLLLYWDLQIGMAMEGMLGKCVLVSCSIFLIPYYLICLYIFPVQAKFENRIRDNLKNALLMSFRHFPSSLLLTVILGTFVVCSMFSKALMGLVICCGAGLCGYLMSNVFVGIFRKYVPEEVEEDAEAAGIR